jgi:hypothetical protein
LADFYDFVSVAESPSMPTLAVGMWRFSGEFNMPTASVGMAPNLPQQKLLQS